MFRLSVTIRPMGERGNLHGEEQPLDEGKADAQPRTPTAVAEVRALLAQGRHDPKQVAAVIDAHPEARASIYELLHQTFGNRFVTEVDSYVAVPAAASSELASPRGAAVAPKQSPAGSPEAMAELQDEITKGIPHPERITMLAGMLGDADRAKVRDTQLLSFEAKLTPAQTIAVYEALGETPFHTAQAAVRRAASARDLSRLVGQLGTDELVEIAADPSLIRSIRSTLPGSFLDYTSATIGRSEIAQSGPLMRWFVESSTPLQVWRAVVSANSKNDLAATFEAEQLWGWVSALSPHGMSWFETQALQAMAKVSPPAIKAQFETLAAASPQVPAIMAAHDPTDAERDAGWKELNKEQQDAGAKLAKKLASTATVTAEEVMDGIGAARDGARVLETNARARARVVELLDVEQLHTFVQLAQFTLGTRLDWMLDKKGVSASHVMELLREDSSPSSAFVNEARVKRMHERLGDDFDLTSVLGMSTELQREALVHAPLRALLLGKQPTARQLLRFVTAGSTADSIASACKTIAKDVGYHWVYELTSEVEGEEPLRRLSIACPNRAARDHLAKFGIQSWALAKNQTIGAAEPSDQAIYQQPDQQLRTDVAVDPSRVAGDAIEMSDEARTAMRSDRKQVNSVITAAAGSSNAGFDAVRTARELDGTLSETLRDVAADLGQIDHGAFRSYARERPPAEQLAVAADPTLAALAEKLLHYSPLAALPALRNPAALAGALRTNPSLLDWIDRTTSAVEALELLGASGEIAQLVAGIMERRGAFHLIKGLPHRGLTVNQRAALARIGAEATGQSLHEAVGDRLEDNAANDGAHGPPTKPDNGKSFRDALDDLRRRNASPQDIQAACSAHPSSEAMDVLYGADREAIATLRMVGVSPLTMFPGLAALPVVQLYGSLPVTDWLLATEEPLALLRSVATTPKALLHVATAIDVKMLGASHFLTQLPWGHGLASLDEGALHAIYTRVTSDEAARALFTTRFGHVPQGEWSRPALDQMWTTLSRLPDRQVEANAKLGGLTRGDTSESSGLGGSYSPGSGVVTISGEVGDEERYTRASWLSKEALAKQLGIDTTEIDRRVDAQRIEKQEAKGVETFRIKTVEGSGFTYTLLHEIGHAVDALLGSRTELVYGMAGWKTYAGGDFDAWASEMGAWNGASVSAEDKADAKQLFEVRLQSSQAIHGPNGDLRDLAPKEHAIKKPDNRGAFLMNTVNGKPGAFRYEQPVAHDGRMYLMNHYYGRFMSYDARIHDILPLPYAGFAPEEFFAECYVEYYRDESTPGGNLPAWIKTWFDQHVNRLGHGPAKKP
jgi:hypothetical protein